MRTVEVPTPPLLEETGDYPRRWADYIGQEPAKKMLQVAAQSARLRKAPLDHVLIGHPTAGIGKTALANLIAVEMRRPCRVVSGVLSGTKARFMFSDMNDGDILFYDEFHQVMDAGKKVAEWLLHYLQDGVIIGPLGPEPQPRVTIVAATTDVGRLPATIVSRFHLQPMLVEYTDEQAARVAQVMARRVLTDDLPKLTKSDGLLVAQAANNNPRAIRSQLVTLRDLALTGTLPVVKGRYDIPGLLDWQGITQDGLDMVAQAYLTILAIEFGGSAGERALAARLARPGGLGSVEQVLMAKGLIARTRSGRALTQAGIKRVRELTT